MPRVVAMNAHTALGVPWVPVHAPVHAETRTQGQSRLLRVSSQRWKRPSRTPDMPHHVYAGMAARLAFCIRAPGLDGSETLYTGSESHGAWP